MASNDSRKYTAGTTTQKTPSPDPNEIDVSILGERWLDANREAIQHSNNWVETNGLPLARFRQF